MTLAEMKEFASFPAATQRYIRRSLDIGLDRDDAMARWSRDVVEAASIRAQARLYRGLPALRQRRKHAVATVGRADGALYAAKAQGRNQVQLAN